VFKCIIDAINPLFCALPLKKKHLLYRRFPKFGWINLKATKKMCTTRKRNLLRTTINLAIKKKLSCTPKPLSY